MTPGDILTFPLSFWLLSIVCLAYYVAIFPFISLGQVKQSSIMHRMVVVGCHGLGWDDLDKLDLPSLPPLPRESHY